MYEDIPTCVWKINTTFLSKDKNAAYAPIEPFDPSWAMHILSHFPNYHMMYWFISLIQIM